MKSAGTSDNWAICCKVTAEQTTPPPPKTWCYQQPWPEQEQKTPGFVTSARAQAICCRPVTSTSLSVSSFKKEDIFLSPPQKKSTKAIWLSDPHSQTQSAASAEILLFKYTLYYIVQVVFLMWLNYQLVHNVPGFLTSPIDCWLFYPFKSCYIMSHIDSRCVKALKTTSNTPERVPYCSMSAANRDLFKWQTQ